MFHLHGPALRGGALALLAAVLFGVSTPLVQHLLATSLGPRNPAADDVRNLLLSPAAGRDRSARLDTRPLAEQILATLQNHSRFHQLSAKFAIQLGGGEALAMLEHHHDLWLSAYPTQGQTLLAFGLAGCPGDTPLGVVDAEQVEPLIEQLLRLFLDLAGGDRLDDRRARLFLEAHPQPRAFAQEVAEILGQEAVGGVGVRGP